MNPGCNPFVFDTTVLYSGGRRTGADSLKTAAEHGFTEEYLGCPDPDRRRHRRPRYHGIRCDYRHFSFGPGCRDYPEGRRLRDLLPLQGAHGILLRRGDQEHLHGDGLARAEAADARGCPSPSDTGTMQPVRSLRRGLPRPARPSCRRMQNRFMISKTCIGCSQCIALCPQMALKIFWDTDVTALSGEARGNGGGDLEVIGPKTVVINALLNITAECDCLPGNHPIIAEDYGFIGGSHPVAVDEASIRRIGAEPFDRAHPGLPWSRQFTYAREIGFKPVGKPIVFPVKPFSWITSPRFCRWSRCFIIWTRSPKAKNAFGSRGFP